MKNNTLLKGMIIGMEDEGSIFIDIKDNSILFEIPKESKLTLDKLRLAKYAFKESHNLILKVKYL